MNFGQTWHEIPILLMCSAFSPAPQRLVTKETYCFLFVQYIWPSIGLCLQVSSVSGRMHARTHIPLFENFQSIFPKSFCIDLVPALSLWDYIICLKVCKFYENWPVMGFTCIFLLLAFNIIVSFWSSSPDNISLGLQLYPWRPRPCCKPCFGSLSSPHPAP